MFFSNFAKTLKVLWMKNKIFENTGIIAKLRAAGERVCWNGSGTGNGYAAVETGSRKEIRSSLISASASASCKSASAAGSPPRSIPARTSLLFGGGGGGGIPFRSILAPFIGSSSNQHLNYSQVRCVTYGREYQPNTLKRKRSVGFLARLKSIGGRKILKRRMMKGRRYLTH